MDNIIKFMIPIGMYLLMLGLLYSKRVSKWMIGVYVRVQSKARLKMEEIREDVEG